MTTDTKNKSSFDEIAVQKQLNAHNLDGWLFYYFKNNDPLALSILKLEKSNHFTRRWFYFVPKDGEPIKLVHQIEPEALDSLPGKKVIYVGWSDMETKLASLLENSATVAMQYSPRNAIPYIARVDAGTIELVTSTNTKVASSHDLVQTFEATWDSSQLESHVFATNKLRHIVDEAFGKVKTAITNGDSINEYDIQQFIMSKFEEFDMTTYSPPIVAINENSGNPHYQPNKDVHKPMKKGDFLLIDLWAKQKNVHRSIYGDITWTGFIGEQVPEKYTKIFNIVRDARDKALQFVDQAVKEKRKVFGWEVDDVARNHISDAGYGKYFVHRTGHSIGEEVHGNGANIDNLETRDERALLPNTGFSIEPGIYMDEFGVRSEIDVFIDETGASVAGQPIQTHVIPILA